MSLDELIKAEREDARAEGIAEVEFRNACALLEAMPNIASAEELSRLIDIPLELACKAIASRNGVAPLQSEDASGDKLPE